MVIDHLRRIAPSTPIIYLDTGFQFPETDRIKEELQARFGLNIVEHRAELSVEDQAQSTTVSGSTCATRNSAVDNAKSNHYRGRLPALMPGSLPCDAISHRRAL